MSYTPPYTVPEVMRLRSEGLTHREIARRFGISPSRVGQLIKAEKERQQSAERSRVIRSEIEASGDLDRKLSLPDFFCVLDLPPRAEAVLRSHFERKGIETFSLRDMMDFLIPAVPCSNDLYDHMPAYRVKWLGQILYAAMMKAMSAVDCGDLFWNEWTERKKRLRKYLVSTGGFYPYVLHGRNPVLGANSLTRNGGQSSPPR